MHARQSAEYRQNRRRGLSGAAIAIICVGVGTLVIAAVVVASVCYCQWSMVGVLKVGFDNPTVFGLEAREDNFRFGATWVQLRAVCRVKLAA
jgi:hypothetical protein